MLKGGGDNGGYILKMCNGHLLVASYLDPKIFLSLFGGLESLVFFFSLSIKSGVFIESLPITQLNQNFLLTKINLPFKNLNSP